MSKKLTIVQIVPEMEEGGVEGETFDLAVELARRGYRSIVISTGGRLVEGLLAAGVEHLSWPGIGSKNFSCLPNIARLRRLMLTEKVDVLHLRSRLPAWVGWLAWKSLPVVKRPAILTTFHGFHSVNCYSKIMTRGERVVAVSKSIKDHIIESYGTDPDKIDIIYGGVDTQQFSPEAVPEQRVLDLARAWGLVERGVPIIVLAGRMTRLKGQDVFIDALAKIKDLNFFAICIGDVPENSYTASLKEKIKSHGLASKVILAGHCKDMPAAFQLSDIVVSASSTHAEAFGKVTIEAMAMAKPVVATAHGGSLEIVQPGKTGWLVPPLDSEGMGQALKEALEDREERERRGALGRLRVEENFTVDVMYNKSIELYHAIVK
ncbi:glycosyltransferase family 4 protein [Desulfotalea psychrophila]|uniref:glycosyltransferase family 4 protein n=1 Tax=Desulfotalea psychrophila TaxID=84980 RepID=UPI0002FBA782|nr:glycosyltransferase family 4 protein [Desulfotalea psychrophila]